jgi:hypothetical protein
MTVIVYNVMCFCSVCVGMYVCIHAILYISAGFLVDHQTRGQL